MRRVPILVVCLLSISVGLLLERFAPPITAIEASVTSLPSSASYVSGYTGNFTTTSGWRPYVATTEWWLTYTGPWLTFSPVTTVIGGTTITAWPMAGGPVTMTTVISGTTVTSVIVRKS